MNPDAISPADLRVLVLAPTGRDAALVQGAFRAAGLESLICKDMPCLVEALRQGAGAALVAEECLVPAAFDLFVAQLADQPPWSDLPVLLLARRGAISDTVSRLLRTLANTIVIERPTQVGELTSAARTALRARARQYQIRDNILQLEASEAKLRETDRRKDEFLAMLAHELRNPLQPIAAAAEVMKARPGSQEDVTLAAGVIDRQVRHLSRLLEDLLDVSRITSGKIVLRRERVEMCALVRRVLEGARPWFESRAQQLLVDVPDCEVWTDGDPARLHQIVSNLLHNAAKYTPEGGRIELRVREGEDDFQVVVKDNGVGIDADVLPHVFELFTQADRSLDRAAGGLGVGLRIVQKLAELHGAKVTAESEGLGQGSTFTLTCTKVAAPAAEAAAQRPPLASDSPPRRILVVDDNVDAAQVLQMLLAMNGHEVDVAHDGLEAIQRVRSMRPDVVVLDIGLPGASGYEVARAIRAESGISHALLVAVTGYGRDEDRVRCMDAGFDAHFVKPLEPQQLLAAVAG